MFEYIESYVAVTTYAPVLSDENAVFVLDSVNAPFKNGTTAEIVSVPLVKVMFTTPTGTSPSLLEIVPV